MTSIELRHVTVRSAEPAPGLSSRAGIRLVELQLLWIQKEHYTIYRAEVHRLGNHDSYTIPDLQADSNGRNVI